MEISPNKYKLTYMTIAVGATDSLQCDLFFKKKKNKACFV